MPIIYGLIIFEVAKKLYLGSCWVFGYASRLLRLLGNTYYCLIYYGNASIYTLCFIIPTIIIAPKVYDKGNNKDIRELRVTNKRSTGSCRMIVMAPKVIVRKTIRILAS